MNDIEKLISISKQIANKEKLDRVYKEILYPRLERAATSGNRNELSVTDNCHDNPMSFVLEGIMGKRITLQHLIETEMRPYLEEKGYKIGICSPNYFVYVRW